MPQIPAYPDFYTFESSPVNLYLHWTSGSSGAVGTVSRKNGFKATPVVHGSTGVYTISLAEPWAAGMLEFKGRVRQATYSSSGACQVQLTADAVTNLTTPTITILVTNAAGAAVDPTTNDFIAIKLELQLQPNNAG